MNIDQHFTSATRLFDELAEQLGIPGDRNRAARILRVVLHTLRDRLTPDESMNLVSHLPLLVKGLYVDGWRIRPKPDRRIRSPWDFVARMRQLDFGAEAGDFPSPESALAAARAVFRVLQHRIGERDTFSVARELPEPLVEFWMAA